MPQLPLSDGHLGGEEEERKDGDVEAEKEDDGGITAKVSKLDFIWSCKPYTVRLCDCLFCSFVNCFVNCLFVCETCVFCFHLL